MGKNLYKLKSIIKSILKNVLPESTIKWIRLNQKKLFYGFHRRDLLQVTDMLADQLSKETLNAYLKLRIYNDITQLKQVTRPYRKQYFDETVFTLGSNEVFVDMGVLDGGTSIKFTELVDGKYNGIILFEPDELSYNRSKENISHLENTIIYNEGASDFCGEVYFAGSGSGGSHISNAQTNFKINVSSLDSKLSEIPFYPTYIKMDIEGSEIAALRGCIKTIEKHKQNLAISIYHKKDDIWKIPFLIKQLDSSYKIYIRHYDISKAKSVVKMGVSDEVALCWELVCYAIQ